jgi:hypothetical protein
MALQFRILGKINPFTAKSAKEKTQSPQRILLSELEHHQRSLAIDSLFASC